MAGRHAVADGAPTPRDTALALANWVSTMSSAPVKVAVCGSTGTLSSAGGGACSGMTLATDQIEVTVSYAYGAHPLIPAFPFLQDALMPASSVLSARPPCISATRWTEIPEPCGPQRLHPDRHGARGQRGIAALEFSLTLTMLLMFICAVVGYGVLFWMQQQLAARPTKARAAVFARFGRARRERRGLHGGNGRVLDRLRGGLRHHPRALRLERRGRTDGQLRHDLHDLQHPVLAGAGDHAGAHRHAARHEQGLDPVQIVFQSHRANLTRDTMSSLSKIIAGVLLAAGLVLAFVAWRLASAPSSPPQPVAPVAASAPAPQEPVKFYPVVVAAKAIPAGTRIAPDMLEVAKWQVALSGGFPAADLLTGAIVRTDVAVGDPILPSMLAHGMASLLQPGERALAVAVDEVSGGGNRILPGDFVDVFFMLDKSAEVQAARRACCNRSCACWPMARIRWTAGREIAVAAGRARAAGQDCGAGGAGRARQRADAGQPRRTAAAGAASAGRRGRARYRPVSAAARRCRRAPI